MKFCETCKHWIRNDRHAGYCPIAERVHYDKDHGCEKHEEKEK